MALKVSKRQTGQWPLTFNGRYWPVAKGRTPAYGCTTNLWRDELSGGQPQRPFERDPGQIKTVNLDKAHAVSQGPERVDLAAVPSADAALVAGDRLVGVLRNTAFPTYDLERVSERVK